MIRWPIVAGIPLTVGGEQASELAHWLLPAWKDSTRSHEPLEIRFEEGDTDARGLRLVAESADAAVGAYFVDAAGQLAVRACATDGAPPQLMRTVEPGRVYRICYEAGQRAGALQWRWPRNVFTYALPTRRLGVVAHATGLRLPDGATVLCPGVSGAGKSTIARAFAAAAAAGVAVLSDDRVALTLEAGTPIVHGTPWYSSAHCATGHGGPLGAIVFPARGEGVNVLEPLSRAEALPRLMRALAYPVWSQAEMDFALDLTSRMLEIAPAYVLRWTPGVGVAPVLAAILTEAVGATAVAHG